MPRMSSGLIATSSQHQLGRWSLRSIGVGEVSLAVAAARGIDRSGTTRALHAALEAGFDLVDVAAEPDSERLAGDAIREMRVRDKVVAALRIPWLAGTPGNPTRDVLPERLPARYVVAQVEASLRSTKLDVLPLAQLALRATWRSSSAWPELAGTCARLVREGKVLEWGAFVERIEDDTPELVKEAWLASISVPYSLCERAANAVLDAARAPLDNEANDNANAAGDGSAEASSNATPSTGLTAEQMRAAGLTPELAIMAGMPADLVLAAAADAPSSAAPAKRMKRTVPLAVLARRPLAGGTLAGTVGPGMKLKHRDDRNDIDKPVLDRIAIHIAKLSRFVKQTPPVARATDAAKLQLEQNKRPEHVVIMTIAELALRYVTTHNAIALPRLHRHEHVLDAFALAMLPPLPAELLEQLDI
jgi:aryl-alcohol dehydrogenase-like predicted oxidoreductase